MIEFMQDDLPEPGGAGDEDVGHLGQVGHDGAPGDVASHGHLERVAGRREAGLLGVEDVAQRDQLAGAVGHLDADGRLARDGGEDAHVGRRHGVGDVLGQAGHPGHLDPGAELELEAGDRRPDPGARRGGSRRRGRPGPAPAPPRRRRSASGPAPSSWRRAGATSAGSVQSPGDATPRARAPASTGSGSASGSSASTGAGSGSGMSMSRRRRGRRTARPPANDGAASRRSRLPFLEGGVVGTGDERLAPPGGQGAAAGGRHRAAQAPEDGGQGDAGGDEDGHDDDGDQEHGRAGGAQPGVQRAADQHAQVAAAPAQRGALGERREMAQLGQAADAEQPEHDADTEAPGVGALDVVGILGLAPVDQQRRPGAGHDHREQHAHPAGHVARDRSRPSGRSDRAGRPTGPGPAGRPG